MGHTRRCHIQRAPQDISQSWQPSRICQRLGRFRYVPLRFGQFPEKMAENPFKTPIDDRAVGEDRRLLRVWKRFLANIETLSKRQAASVTDLGAGTPTNDDLKAKMNELLDAMRSSDQMKSS